MRRVTLKLSVSLPDGPYCNLQNPLKPWLSTNTVCRFCTKEGVCLLYNIPLAKMDKLVAKCTKCQRLVCGFKEDIVEDTSGTMSDIAKQTFSDLAIIYAQAIKNGSTDVQAMNIAIRRIGGSR